MYEIETNIPAPPRGAVGRRTKYPFAVMKVGQCFFEPDYKSSVASSAHGYGKRHGKKFTSLREGKGVRIWRVE